MLLILFHGCVFRLRENSGVIISVISGLGVKGCAVAMEMMVCNFGFCTISLISFICLLTTKIQAQLKIEDRIKLTKAVTRNQSATNYCSINK